MFRRFTEMRNLWFIRAAQTMTTTAPRVAPPCTALRRRCAARVPLLGDLRARRDRGVGAIAHRQPPMAESADLGISPMGLAHGGRPTGDRPPETRRQRRALLTRRSKRCAPHGIALKTGPVKWTALTTSKRDELLMCRGGGRGRRGLGLLAAGPADALLARRSPGRGAKLAHLSSRG